MTNPTGDALKANAAQMLPCPFCAKHPRLVEPHESGRSINGAVEQAPQSPAPEIHVRGDECRYAKDQGFPEHRCAVRCVYEDQTMGNTEARSTLWNFAIEACAALIDKNIIMDTSAGKVLAPRQDGNRDGLHYATAIRGLAAAEGHKAALQPISDDSLQAQIGGIGNQIHNLGCEHHNNEELAERLGELASSLWSIAASVRIVISQSKGEVR